MSMKINDGSSYSRIGYAEEVKENRLRAGPKRQRMQRRPLRRPNRMTNTSAVKDRAQSLPGCTG